MSTQKQPTSLVIAGSPQPVEGQYLSPCSQRCLSLTSPKLDLAISLKM